MSYPFKASNPFANRILEENIQEFYLLSPDGFTISPDAKVYTSIDDAKKDYELWLKNYTSQGYYSSNTYHRIKLEYLWAFMILHTFPFCSPMNEDYQVFFGNWYHKESNLDAEHWQLL